MYLICVPFKKLICAVLAKIKNKSEQRVKVKYKGDFKKKEQLFKKIIQVKETHKKEPRMEEYSRSQRGKASFQ